MRWGGKRAGRFPARYLLCIVLLLAAAVGLARPGLAVDLVDISRPLPQQDLAAYLAGLQTSDQTITTATPARRMSATSAADRLTRLPMSPLDR